MLFHSGPEGLTLRGTSTPFNHCEPATNDMDLGSGGALLLPDLDASAAATSKLRAVGGKRGNVYLIDRERMPGQLDRRPPCGADASADASLLPPQSQPQFGKRGPLNVFGPYSETDGAMDVARGRSCRRISATRRARAISSLPATRAGSRVRHSRCPPRSRASMW